MIKFWQTVFSSAVVASIISIIGSKIVESKNNKRNNYAKNVIAHKVDELDKFKMLYSKFMSNCIKVADIVSNNDSGDFNELLNELLKEIETIKIQLQLSIDDSFIKYKEFSMRFEKYVKDIREIVKYRITYIDKSNEDELLRMVYIYIFFENIWIEKNLSGSENDMSKIYSEAKKKYNEICSEK